MAGQWTIQLLGGITARQGTHVVSRFRTHKTALLLAYLAYHPEGPIPRERLSDVLWPESELIAARNSLSVSLSSLRSQLEPPNPTPGTSPIGGVLVADRSTIRLNPDAFTTDVAAFETARQKAAGDGESIETLTNAVRQYGGEFLPGFYDDWVLTGRDRLTAFYQQTLIRLVGRLIDAGEMEPALEYAQRAVQGDPLGEESNRLLMRVYAGLGQPAAVRAQLLELERRRKYAGEAPPQPETRVLADQLAGSAPSSRAASSRTPSITRTSPPVKSVNLASPASLQEIDSSLNHLPVPLTRFFGQQEAIERLVELLSGPGTRLVTLTGPGGCGKTRLALEAARRLADASDSPAETWFVPLADISDPGRLFDAIRDELGLPRSADADALDQIAERLAGTESVALVLDNLEHLLGKGATDPEGAAALVRRLLARLPHVRLLATSRQALGIAREQEFPVSLLTIPGDSKASPSDLLEYPSVQLFVDRARQRRVDFQVTAHNADAVAGLVTRLEGIPLAIELTAAWSRLLAPSQMLERLADPFAMLVSQNRRLDIPERQRTLWGALSWGHELLPPDARRVFAALSVFRGDWSASAAQKLFENTDGDEPFLPSGRVLECLSLLQSASLLITDETAEEMRFRMLETVREFASALLTKEERETWERRHAAYFLARSAEGFQHRYDGLQKRWFDRLEEDLPNFRAVLERTLTMPAGIEVFCTLVDFWRSRGYVREGRDWSNRLLAAYASQNPGENSNPKLAARFLNCAAILAEDTGDHAQATGLYERSIALYAAENDVYNVALVRSNLAGIAMRLHDLGRARQQFQEALDYFRHTENRRQIATVLGNLGLTAMYQRQFEDARAFYDECLTLAREVGDLHLTASTLHNLGSLAMAENDYVRARTLYAESLAAKRILQDQTGIAILQISLAFLALDENRFADAVGLFAAALEILRSSGTRYRQITCLEGMGWCALRLEQHLVAARLWAAAQAARSLFSLPWADDERETYPPLHMETRTTAPSLAAYDTAWAEGSTLSLDDAVASALAHFPPVSD